VHTFSRSYTGSSELHGFRYFQCILDDDVGVVEAVDTRKRYQGDTLERSYCDIHPVKALREAEEMDAGITKIIP